MYLQKKIRLERLPRNIGFGHAVVILALVLTPSVVAAQEAGGATGGVISVDQGELEVDGSSDQPLTQSECTDLGGSVFEQSGENAFCKSHKYCGTTDESGKRHRVCLEVDAFDDGLEEPERKADNGVVDPATGGLLADGFQNESLTADECEGLGGKVSPLPPGNPDNCPMADICATTNKKGVIKIRCIDEVSQ